MKKLLIFMLLLTACGTNTTPPDATHKGPDAMPQVAPGNCEFVGQVAGVDLWAGDCVAADDAPTETVEPTVTDTETATAEPSATDAPPTDTPAPSDTPLPTETLAATSTPSAPFASAPLCPNAVADHDTSTFHTLWDAVRGCHYDHEHGTSPFTDEVAATFPGFDLLALLGGVQVGHSNPSSPVENVAKHGGFKWDVTLSHDVACAGRENVPTGVDAFVAQYHGFGNYAIEFEARIHSAAALMRQCQAGNPTDYGYVFTIQHHDYGQRTAPYQGTVLPYPDSPQPAYDSAREPYNTIACYGGVGKCGRSATYASFLSGGSGANSTWVSEPVNLAGNVQRIFFLLFRLRDTYQVLNAADMVHPFDFRWLCSNDGGLTYAQAAGCKYNNTTTRIHEIGGIIPAAWDNQPFDSDPRVGRITAEGFTDAAGQWIPEGVCFQGQVLCFPIKLVNAFTGAYGARIAKADDPFSFGPGLTPERDIYFCGLVQCAEGDPGAQSSGWVGPNN